jgi:L-histidine N-alpha-methyltransferase
MTPTPAELIITRHLSDDHAAKALRADAATGLTSAPKWLPPRWFYDARGSELFEEITRLPEYYPTRAEREVLTENAAEIAAISGAAALVELGSGSSEKTRLLLDALVATGSLRTYIPVDVSESALTAAGDAVRSEYQGLAVHAVVADFCEHLDLLPGAGGRRLVAFLGGTIGNLIPAERAIFLADLASVLEPGDWLLLGTDLVKSPDALVPAYDDAAGVTAEFNRNVLAVLNAELGADFDLRAFEHVARWDDANEWIEMRLRSVRKQAVVVAALGLTVDFAAGEEIRTEVSAKFRRDGIAAELAAARFEMERWWTDPDGRFGVSLSRVDGGSMSTLAP